MYKILHLPSLPQVPDHLINYTLDMDEDCMCGSDPNRMLTKNGKSFKEGLQRKEHADANLESWIKENIIADFKDVGYWRGLAPCTGPHLDRTRFFLLIYVLESGGTNVPTVFYRANTEHVEIDYDGTRVNNYDQLEVDEVFYLEPKQWYLLNGKSGLHSVENIETVRVSLQVGLMRDPIDRVKLI